MERKVDIEKLRRKNKKRKAIKKLPSPEITKANLDIWSTVNIKINLFLKMAAIAITIAIIIFIWIDNKIINYNVKKYIDSFNECYVEAINAQDITLLKDYIEENTSFYEDIKAALPTYDYENAVYKEIKMPIIEYNEGAAISKVGKIIKINNDGEKVVETLPARKYIIEYKNDGFKIIEQEKNFQVKNDTFIKILRSLK
ncbi:MULTISPECIES: hypothetical protein [unclassified Clostridium]|uniref:TcaA NTF2-like domain-containing protein n=1 Tax=unclassified Clostridium TaxID=2614128 RepID=UPI0018987102|nr:MULTISPECIES: hypothetical protein [unclassified Clostridium]MBP3917129.1 hypothetical protein [Clostridium sp.]MEE0933051.1 hypothetical protein [Clostridium sp.]